MVVKLNFIGKISLPVAETAAFEGVMGAFSLCVSVDSDELGETSRISSSD